jgi:hypothetical protein
MASAACQGSTELEASNGRLRSTWLSTVEDHGERLEKCNVSYISQETHRRDRATIFGSAPKYLWYRTPMNPTPLHNLRIHSTHGSGGGKLEKYNISSFFLSFLRPEPEVKVNSNIFCDGAKFIGSNELKSQ